jgi:branched-chain amino acid transport system permease protein
MRLVNIAHGDFIVLAAYLALAAVSMLGLHPFAAIVPVAALMFGLGYALQRALLNRTLGPDILPPLLVTFGLSILVQNGLLEAFSADSRSLQVGDLATASLRLGDSLDSLTIGWLPLIVFGVAVLLTLAVHALFSRTPVGIALRATSDDPATAGLMGIRARHVYALALGLSFALVAVGGVFAGIRTTFTPDAGPASLLYAFEAVVIGGLGSLWGTFAGAIVVGVAQVVGARIDAGLGVLAGHLVFLAVLMFRPSGLFARTR